MTTKQWTNLKFLVQHGKTPTEALRLLQIVYEDLLFFSSLKHFGHFRRDMLVPETFWSFVSQLY